jgi:hypothetical protein
MLKLQSIRLLQHRSVAGSYKNRKALYDRRRESLVYIVIGDYVKIQAQSGIGRNVKDNEVLQGSPALNYGTTISHTYTLRIYQRLLTE